MRYLSIILLLALMGCQSPNSPNTELSTSQPYAGAKKVSVQGDSLSQLAEKIPGFGGLFINESNKLSIYLTRPDTQKPKAEAVMSSSELITKALSSVEGASVSNMVVKKGTFTFSQLYAWKNKITLNVLAMDGVYSNSIDESQNKLFVGVKDQSVKKKAVKKLE